MAASSPRNAGDPERRAASCCIGWAGATLALESATAKGSCHQGEPTGVGPNPSQTAHLERQTGPRRKGLWQASSRHSGQWPGKQSHGAQRGNEETFQPAALKSPGDCSTAARRTAATHSSERHGAISPGRLHSHPRPGVLFSVRLHRQQNSVPRCCWAGSLFPCHGAHSPPHGVAHSSQPAGGCLRPLHVPPKDSPD